MSYDRTPVLRRLLNKIKQMLDYREGPVVFRNGIFHFIKEVAFVIFSFAGIILMREFRHNQQKACVLCICLPFVPIPLCVPLCAVHDKYQRRRG